NRLDQRRRDIDALSIRRRLGNAAEELEKLRRMENGVGDGRFLDQPFLRHLPTKVAALLQAFRANDRQRNVMLDARLYLCRNDVTPRSFKERQNRLILERR